MTSIAPRTGARVSRHRYFAHSYILCNFPDQLQELRALLVRKVVKALTVQTANDLESLGVLLPAEGRDCDAAIAAVHVVAVTFDETKLIHASDQTTDVRPFERRVLCEISNAAGAPLAEPIEHAPHGGGQTYGAQ